MKAEYAGEHVPYRTCAIRFLRFATAAAIRNASRAAAPRELQGIRFSGDTRLLILASITSTRLEALTRPEWEGINIAAMPAEISSP
jgi:hypothetical protein